MIPAPVETAHETAATAALGFLLGARNDRGAWEDFLLPAGRSDVWVSAFVGQVLARRREPEACAAAREAWAFLEGAAASGGGWSYNRRVPPDGDSTLWGLRLAAALGVEEAPAARAAAGFLARHVREDGGLTTYASAGPVRDYIGLPAVVPFGGWTRSHGCVSAAGAHLRAHGKRLRRYLLDTQRPDGRWAAYWWFDDELATAEAVTALAGSAKPAAAADAEPVERATGWAAGRAEELLGTGEERPSAFVLAHLLRILAHGGRSERVARARAGIRTALLDLQRPDGSWPPGARLRVPRPDAVVPDPAADWSVWAGMPPGPPTPERLLRYTFDNYSPDHRAVYTTATVLEALRELDLPEGDPTIDPAERT